MQKLTFAYLIGSLLLTANLSFAAGNAAGNTTLMVNYPSVQGSYNRILLNPQSTGSSICSSASNLGALFMYTDNNGNQVLSTCYPGNSTPIPYRETCFNRFCSTPTSAGSCLGSISCGTFGPEYAQANINPSNNNVDQFSPDGTIQVYSIVCCDNNSIVLNAINGS